MQDMWKINYKILGVQPMDWVKKPTPEILSFSDWRIIWHNEERFVDLSVFRKKRIEIEYGRPGMGFEKTFDKNRRTLDREDGPAKTKYEIWDQKVFGDILACDDPKNLKIYGQQTESKWIVDGDYHRLNGPAFWKLNNRNRPERQWRVNDWTIDGWDDYVSASQITPEIIIDTIIKHPYLTSRCLKIADHLGLINDQIRSVIESGLLGAVP